MVTYFIAILALTSCAPVLAGSGKFLAPRAPPAPAPIAPIATMAEDVSSFAQTLLEVSPANQEEDDKDATCLLAELARPMPTPATDLNASSSGLDLLQPERLERALYAEVEAVLQGRHAKISQSRFHELSNELAAVFPALPKNAQGGLEHSVARYALFQRFLRRHGWYIRGFNPAGESQTPATPGEALRAKVPENLLKLLEGHINGRGIGLREFAAVAAVLEHLIRGDLIERVRSAYANYNLSSGGMLAQLDGLHEPEVAKVLQAFMAHYVSLEHRSGYALTAAEARHELKQIESYVNWWKIKDFIREAMGPAGSTFTFDLVVDVAQRVTDHFEEFSSHECGLVRKGFVGMPGGDSGRVSLALLHEAVLQGQGSFAESTEYLRKLGAVDDSDPVVPHVLLPNYIAGSSNCMATTSFYDLCCPSECESILERLEKSISAPNASPSQIRTSLGDRASLPESAWARLSELARAHGGRLPLHGFSFAEWLHGSFPRDCPRPLAENYGPQHQGEVPEASHEFQAGADLKTFADITASTEELMLEKMEFEAIRKSKGSQQPGSDAPDTDGLTPGVRAIDDLARASALDMMRPERLERALLSEVQAVLAGSHAEVEAKRVTQIEGQLAALFNSLPKNDHGMLSRDAARYALFQRFSRRRGWIVHSLNPAGEAQAPSSKAEELRGQVPLHLITLLEKEQGARGLSLPELAAIAATLEHLISGDMDQRLKAAYVAHLLPPSSALSHMQAPDVLKTLMAHFMSLEHRSGYAMTPEAAQKEEEYISKSFPGWRRILGFVERALRRHAAENHGAPLSFTDMKAVAQDVLDRYEEQSASECLDLKRDFSALPNGTSGSVLLEDLHRAAMDGKGLFRESTAYLATAGILDASDISAPRVVLPNYIYSSSNCLGTTSFADMCCPNECDLILEHLEQKLQTPEVDAADVANALSSASAYRLSPEALTRLYNLAFEHHGSLTLHGHVFADWLHFAFPSECPLRQASDFTHSSARLGHEEEDEVLGAEREYQQTASFKSVADIAASDDELVREVEQLHLLHAGANNSSTLGSGIEASTLEGLAAQKLAMQATGLPAFDLASFAQTEMQVQQQQSHTKQEI